MVCVRWTVSVSQSAVSYTHLDVYKRQGLLYGFTTGRGAAQAMHADGQKQRRSLRGNIQDVADDGTLFNFSHKNSLLIRLGLLYPEYDYFSRETKKFTDSPQDGKINRL